ncbi:MAG: protein-glutamate O-methyltransferase, partial [Acidocella sp.]|nr:protein-glutamate O-methyltransferase [Acidocella sp.]
MTAQLSMSSAAKSQATLVENAEFVFTAHDLAVVVRIMMQEAGISLSGAKANLVYSRLAKRVRKLGLSSFAEYCALVESQEGEDERQEMVAALTTNVTRFFREPHHFEHLRTKVLPGLIAQARAGKRVRLWSAACSSGQEPYSMALTLLSEMPDAGRYDIKILATDIDPNVLATGEAGIYEDSLLEPVPAAMRKTWFTPVNGGQMRANDELRALISFRKLNLIGSWPMKGKFQAVFCRNVVIYFENNTQEAIWSRFVPLMDDNVVLY